MGELEQFECGGFAKGFGQPFTGTPNFRDTCVMSVLPSDEGASVF